ncbi:hypothetical protein FHETE_4462 [Fusarium heterosporum]|uniref:Uncharacterized protein n=1 Tax=Fusarium heterosporum TaxID=42747 RepID=A0A8H5TE77_FUSHE|nr:hypothetical protein FHETE_4462 [Fusarium heterosporum]
MTKSPETEPVESPAEQVETSLKRKCSSKVKIAKNDHEGIRARQDSAISRILPDAKNNPELYRQVVDRIMTSNLRACWSSSPLSKDFTAWRRASGNGQDSRPDLVFLLTVLAVLDSDSQDNPKVNIELNRLGLRQWAEEQLNPQRPIPAIEEQPSSGTLRRAPQVKVEQMGSMASPPPRLTARNSIVRQSIESDPSCISAAGLKRSSVESSSEPVNKRSKVPADPAFSASRVEPSTRTIVLRDGSTQTDNVDLPLATSSILEVMKKMEGRMESFEVRFQEFQEHSRALQEHNRTLGELLGRAREGNQLRPVNVAHHRQFQHQAHEIVPVQSISRQPRAYYLPSDRVSDNNDSIFMF